MAAPNSKVYVVSLTRQSIAGAITLIQIAAGAATPLQLIRACLGQTSSTTATQQSVQINRKTAAATVTTFTPKKCGPATDPVAQAIGGANLTGINASAEGTDGDILVQDVFDYLYGWLWAPDPANYKYVDAGGFAGLKLPVAPGAATIFTCDLYFMEP